MLAWHLHIYKPPIVCTPFRGAIMLMVLKTEEFWEFKTYAKGVLLTEFC